MLLFSSVWLFSSSAWVCCYWPVQLKQRQRQEHALFLLSGRAKTAVIPSVYSILVEERWSRVCGWTTIDLRTYPTVPSPPPRYMASAVCYLSVWNVVARDRGSHNCPRRHRKSVQPHGDTPCQGMDSCRGEPYRLSCCVYSGLVSG